jgi:hypothetical protein
LLLHDCQAGSAARCPAAAVTAVRSATARET